ncbi:MAG: DNA-directed RNA polymerase subunit alpha [Magnetococcales bacterium]|nr:DNA-directed RNA polymerase subunit alpha [Magnetococcales bacterium]
MYRNWTELIKPSKVDFVGSGDSQHKATIVVEPLERGFGTTLGNALRRVLISSLQGSAISSVRVEGFSQEIVAVPGVAEDLTEIVLNLKGVVIHTESCEPQTLSLVSDLAGVVTAASIICGKGIQILNPDHYIATVNRGGRLDMVMTVTTGRGYVPAVSVDDGGIPIDCSYSPVKYAAYHVSNARIGQQTDYDKLVFDIETNGIISPEDAMNIAARILRDQLDVFINFDPAAFEKEQEVDSTPRWNPALFHRVDDLEFTVRSANVLRALGLVYIGDLVQKTAQELLMAPNFGRKSLGEINDILAGMELSLGTPLDGWPPEDVEAIAKQMDL